MLKYMLYKFVMVILLLVYGYWLLRQLTRTRPELLDSDNIVSIGAAAVVLIAVVWIVAGHKYWYLVVPATIIGVLAFQKFWELHSDDSLRLTVYGLILIGLIALVLPLDREVVKYRKQRKSNKNGGNQGSTPSGSFGSSSSGGPGATAMSMDDVEPRTRTDRRQASDTASSAGGIGGLSIGQSH